MGLNFWLNFHIAIDEIEASGVKNATVKLKSSYDQKTVIAAANLDQEW